ncbi:nitrilase-related carbon-nitrogen hydrolase [Actinopolymorpha pittospori]|uniref:Amidohydrolase n=1 Tax=Actinopolymorpha pittospori TaxID=648752 RepID=A0A927RNS1_9ACTN|nr:putative amidohydrolase [Actinopolymorpha pittospori]
MTRRVRVGAAQLGPHQESSTPEEILARLLALLEQAIAERVQVLVYPELALTTYFPKRIRSDAARFFSTAMPAPMVAPLFERAREAGIAFHLGYAERTADGRQFNTAVYVDERGEVVGKYRKLHLPGLADGPSARPGAVYEPYYFAHGDTGFQAFQTTHAQVGIAICQDRRFPETYRALALDGAELVLIGYNTPAGPLAYEQNELVMRAGAYSNSVFVVGVAKAGTEDGVELIGGSCVIDPFGQVLARAATTADELVTTSVDVDQARAARERWNFLGRRHPGHYTSLTEPVRVPETKSRLR